MSNKNTIIVYWSPIGFFDRITLLNLTLEPPIPIRTLLPTSINKEDSYRACTAANNMWDKMFAIKHPKTSTVKLFGELLNPQIDFNEESMWIKQPSSFDGYRVTYDYSWIFFCEESLVVQQTPSFMHNTSDKMGGRIAAGEFDIGKWFRPLNIDYLLWPNSNSITVTKDEPIMYLKFYTNKKIILKQFEITPELINISNQISKFKTIMPMQPLTILYDRFIKSNRHKQIAKIIKENILE